MQKKKINRKYMKIDYSKEKITIIEKKIPEIRRNF